MKERLVLTLSIGGYFEKMGRLTHPLIKGYAEKCGAEFEVIRKAKLEKKLGLPTYEKFQIYEYLKGRYKQVLFIDTDIVVCPDAPNIFEICHDAAIFCASNEEKYSLSGLHKQVTQEKLGEIDWRNPYFNSGVFLVTPQHKDVFDPDGDMLRQWVSYSENSDHVMSDQPILNYMFNKLGYKMHDLGYRFNHTRVITDTKTRFNSYFIHYAGPSGHRYGDRLKQIELDVAVANSMISYALSKKVPSYRWFADRFDIDFVKYQLDKFL